MSDLRKTCKYFAEELKNAYNNGELYDYLGENSYDVELRISPDRVLRSVQIMLAGGGPTIYLDTKQRGIVGYWGNKESYYSVDRDICDEVESSFADMYGYEL